ncbi:MAG TPA: hypothetical protein VE999_01040 [Gemmataceae bacterium]|nr:hypothetical protein [Gemmataceae bacterium]
MVTSLVEVFPGLAKGNYQITSPANPDYNCMAWAVGDIGKWWWPGPDEKREYWPPDILREPTQNAFEAAFARFGYERCMEEDVEPGFEKIALFADASGKPTHVARQLATGRWTSKLGRMEDIEHVLRDLEGVVYGSVVLILKRPVTAIV